MEIGIIGLPQTGKKTIFSLLTAGSASSKSSSQQEAKVGIGIVRDPRFDRLVQMYHPKKITPANIRFVLLPKIEKNAGENEAFFKEITTVDAICHIVRAFQDETIFHVEGTVDPIRDIDLVNAELILHDLLFIEKRLERLTKELKAKADEKKKKEESLLLSMKLHLEENFPLRTYTFSDDDLFVLSGYPLLTRKPMLIVLNISEDMIHQDSILKKVQERHLGQKVEATQVSVKIEEEILHLENDEEKVAFLKDLGIQEPAIDRLSRLCFHLLGLISYFTVGEDEVRAWIINKGSNAPEAAGAIHSDLQRGFIRAELIKYEDLIQLGSENKVKEAGKLLLKGKDYIVEDGDILSFRCNV